MNQAATRHDNTFQGGKSSARGYSAYHFVLVLLLLLTIGMISLGGITRLTGSGLSMVNWEPIMGIIPPFTESDWQERFREYQKFPEYRILNFDITLANFKVIFLYEYLHRLLGRVIGILTFILLLLTLWKQNPTKIRIQSFMLLVVVGIQGLMGWYMVKSGLTDVPQVSHYRLLAHFLLALLFLTMLWHLLFQSFPIPRSPVSGLLPLLIKITMMMSLLQIIFGTLQAGLDAGLASTSYPLMFGQWIPENLMSFPGTLLDKLFDNPVFINFFHRHFGILTAGFLILSGSQAYLSLRKSPSPLALRYLCLTLIALAIVQPLIGILTLVLRVPVGWGVIHQLVAVLIWSNLFSLKILTGPSQ